MLLGALVIANGAAVSLSAYPWGRMADTSSRQAMCWGGLLAGIAGLVIVAGTTFVDAARSATWFYVLLFFTLGIAHAGIRVGRKTYVVDSAQGNRRTDYVAISNTVIGVALLVSSGLGALSVWISPQGIVLLLAVAALAGSALTRTLPNVE